MGTFSSFVFRAVLGKRLSRKYVCVLSFAFPHINVKQKVTFFGHDKLRNKSDSRQFSPRKTSCSF